MSRGAEANERAIGKGSRRAYEDRLFAIAAFLINERGYLVLACWYGAYDVGQITNNLWNIDIPQPLRITGKTDKQDWEEQCAMARSEFRPKFDELYIGGQGKTGSEADYFYRAITD